MGRSQTMNKQNKKKPNAAISSVESPVLNRICSDLTLIAESGT